MKIIIINKYHYIDGGPERYMFNLSDYLKSIGHEVIPFAMAYAQNNPSEYEDYFVESAGGGTESKLDKLEGGIKTKIKIAARSIYSHAAKQALDKLIADTNPDIVYCLNIVNHMSPSVVDAAHEHNIPVVSRLSDYYLTCPSYLYLREGQICTECEHGYYHALRHKCVHGSFSSTLCRVAGMYINKLLRVYNKVSAFVTTTEFMKDTLTRTGFPQQKIHCIPTPVDLSLWTPNYDNDGYILYFGRLSPEKGIEFMLDAYISSAVKDPLVVAGDGPAEYVEHLKSLLCENNGKEVRFIGKKSGDELRSVVSGAKYVVVPSLWYDNAPNVIYESFAAGKPVIGSALGGIREQINDSTGILVEPGNVLELSEAIKRLSSSPELIVKLGQGARQQVVEHNNIADHACRLIGLFNRVRAAKT